MESINDQLKMLERKKYILNTPNTLNDTIKVFNEIADIYVELSESCKDKLYITGGGDYAQKAVNLRTLLTQLELQNDALISRMKGIINE
jgi:dihydrofolate reductase